MQTALREFFLLHRRNLVVNLVARNFKVKFRGSVLGYLWTLVIPLSQVLVFYFVYQKILKIPIPNYLAFVVTGIMPWVFFASTINESLESLVAGQSLLTHMPMPVQTFPAATVLTNFISFMLSAPIILTVVLFSGISVGWSTLWLVPLLSALVIFTYSLALILAMAYVYFRDLKYIFSIFLNLWIYATPVLYSMEIVPDEYRWIFWVNPLSGFFVAIRDVLVFSQPLHMEMMAVFFMWSFAVMVVANFIRWKAGSRLVERL